MTALTRHPDRLLPADPSTRAVARRLYDIVRAAPIVSPHGHLDAQMLLDDLPFNDAAALFITRDHYVTRLLHTHGSSLDELGVGASNADPRIAWRALCSLGPRLAGTAIRYWLEDQFVEVFGINQKPSAENADELFDLISEKLTKAEFHPLALVKRFGIEVLATTDDPAADLTPHRMLADASGLAATVIPTFRPDRFLNPDSPTWKAALDELQTVSGMDCGTYTGLLAALKSRRAEFIELGATSLDISTQDAWVEPLEVAEASRLHREGMNNSISAADATAYARNLIYRMAEMSLDDGLVMQFHPGVLRNHHGDTLERFGSDTGHDLPVPIEYSRPLRRLLNDFGHEPGFQLVLFTVDEVTFGRDLAPLAGFYPSVFVGAPWWFLDAPDAMSRFRRSITSGIGFYKTSGFIDDTRALCSIPSRHDMSRRIDSSYLAELVVRHELDEDEAVQISHDLVSMIPSVAFKLPPVSTTNVL